MAKGQGFAETPRAGPLDAADGRDRRRQPPLIGPLDPVLALALPILAGLAWTVPERLWPAITASLKPFQVLDLSARPKDTARRIEAVLGERDGVVAEVSAAPGQSLAQDQVILEFAA